jgi:hypothetical protein
MSISMSASTKLTPHVWRCRLAVGVTGAHAGWRWQPASGTWPLDAMRPSEPFVRGRAHEDTVAVPGAWPR